MEEEEEEEAETTETMLASTGKWEGEDVEEKLKNSLQ